MKFEAKSTQPSCGKNSAYIDMTKFMKTLSRIMPMAALPKSFPRMTPGGQAESAQDSHKREVPVDQKRGRGQRDAVACTVMFTDCMILKQQQQNPRFFMAEFLCSRTPHQWP